MPVTEVGKQTLPLFRGAMPYDIVIKLDSGRVNGVGLPACRTSPPCPHQAGGDLIVIVPKGPRLSLGSTDGSKRHFGVSP